MSEVFAIKIDFDKSLPKPSRVFSTMSDLIHAFESIDKLLLNSISLKIESEVLLEDIEAGSLIGKFKYLLESMDDEAIKELDWKRLIGSFLLKGKYSLLDFINQRAMITSKEEIKALEQEILSLANECKLNELTNFTAPNKRSLLDGMNQLLSATKNLDTNDKISFFAEEKSVEFNLSFQISEESIQELLTAQTITSTQDMILKVKKPDYLGDSKWELRRGKTPISARILDQEWVNDFRSRKIPVFPGDSLLAEVECISKYDSSGELISDTFNILKVKEVMIDDPSN